MSLPDFSVTVCSLCPLSPDMSAFGMPFLPGHRDRPGLLCFLGQAAHRGRAASFPGSAACSCMHMASGTRGLPSLTGFFAYMFFLKAWRALNNEHRDPNSPPFPIKCKTPFYVPGIYRAVPWPSSMVAATSDQMAGSEPADEKNCLFKNHWASGRGQIGGDRQWGGPLVQGVPEDRSSPRSISVSSPGHLWLCWCIETTSFFPKIPNASLYSWFLLKFL